MNFTNDTLWNKAKQLGKREGHANDWCYIITLYNALGGKYIQLYIVDSESSTKYRVLAATDQEITYVLLNGGVTHLKTSEAFKMKKVFENKELKNEQQEFLSDETVLGKDNFKYYD